MIRHPISPSTALSLANDAEKHGDATSAAEWLALAEELDTSERNLARQAAEARKAVEKEQLFRHARRYGL